MAKNNTQQPLNNNNNNNTHNFLTTMEFSLLFYHFAGTGDVILKFFTGRDADQL